MLICIGDGISDSLFQKNHIELDYLAQKFGN